ncbi:MAG: hypothetical protein ACE5JL_07495 [Dehalococcoidia bacterium]
MGQVILRLSSPSIVRKVAFEDRHEIRVASWIQPWDFVEPIDAGLASSFQ